MSFETPSNLNLWVSPSNEYPQGSHGSIEFLRMMLSSCLVIKINNSHLKFLTCFSLKNIVLIKYDIPQNEVNDDQIKSVVDCQLIYICGSRVSS